MTTSVKDVVSLLKNGMGATVGNALADLLQDMQQALSSLQDDGIINPTTLSTGSTPANVATTAFQYRIDGVPATKAAVAAGTALGITDTINTGTATGSFFGGFAAQINAAGTISFQAAAADQVHTTLSAALTAAKAITPTAGNVIIGWFVVEANADSAWTAGTDDLTPASDCASVSYYSAPSTLSNYVTA
jgi:hypothetical protein